MDSTAIAAAAAMAHRAQAAQAIAVMVAKQARAQDQAMVALLESAVQATKAVSRSGPPVPGSAGIVDIRA